MTPLFPELPPIDPDLRARILQGPATAERHRALMAEAPAMAGLETGGVASCAALPADLTIVAWNAERCLFPQASADLLAPHGPSVVLLSEVDLGMARTGQRHTTAEMAAALGMSYAYGVEFYELGLGGPTERDFCRDPANRLGFHGNAILSSAPFSRLALIRLDTDGHWFAAEHGAADPDQPRLGGRMAIAAEIGTRAGPVCVVSTHLESNADAALRGAQFDALMDAVDGFAPGLPVVIGGDLNTGNHQPPDFDWRGETLFEAARARGYDWSMTPEGMTTRPSLITPHPTRKMKLDWFCARGLTGRGGQLLTALDPEGTPLSDHEPILARFSGAAPG